ncbi:hypothetical protein RFI_31162, partial [Reticulomyxa filosa]
ACQMLCNALEESKQYTTLHHINLSKNHFGTLGSKALASLIEKCGGLLRLVMADCELDGNEFLTSLNPKSITTKEEQQLQQQQQQQKILLHWTTLLYLDLSYNTNIGDKGSVALSTFSPKTVVLSSIKLAGCNLSASQLQRIFRGAMSNMSGFDGHSKSDAMIPNTHAGKSIVTELNEEDDAIHTFLFYPIQRPTQEQILLANNLVCMSLDLSENNLTGKGAEVLLQELTARENYTIVGLNLAKNNLNGSELSMLLCGLTNLACLERICVSENVKKLSFAKSYGANAQAKGDVGYALATLCRNVPTLNEIAITGNRKTKHRIDHALSPFVQDLPFFTNLEFIDISGNRIGLCNHGALWNAWIDAFKQNRTLRVVKFFGNKLSKEQMLTTLQVLACHVSVFQKLPKRDLHKLFRTNAKFNKSKKQLQLQDALEKEKKEEKTIIELFYFSKEIFFDFLLSIACIFHCNTIASSQYSSSFHINVKKFRFTAIASCNKYFLKIILNIVKMSINFFFYQ